MGWVGTFSFGERGVRVRVRVVLGTPYNVYKWILCAVHPIPSLRNSFSICIYLGPGSPLIW